MLKRLAILVASLSLLWTTGCSDSGAEDDSISTSPAGRLVSLKVPEGIEAARAAGCTVTGAYVGSGLSSLQVLGGGLDQMYQGNARGEVDLVLISQARNFESETGTPFELELFRGGQNEDKSFNTIPTELVIYSTGVPVGAYFTDVVLDSEGWFETETETLSLPLPILDDLRIQPALSVISLTGQLTESEEGGINIDGLLLGYMLSEEAMSIVIVLQEVCRLDEPPVVCQLMGGAFTNATPEDAFNLFVNFMGSFDARIVDGLPRECDMSSDGDDACNAVSICMQVGFESVVLTD